MKKIYLVYSSKIEPFKEVVQYCRIRFANIVSLDTDDLKFQNAITSIQNIPYKSKSDKKLVKVSNKINKILEYEYDNTFKLIINRIESIDSESKLIFIKINDLTMITKLKRHYKRTKYVTIKINNNETLPKLKMLEMIHYQFDLIINNVNSEILHEQIINFVKLRVPKRNFIKQ